MRTLRIYSYSEQFSCITALLISHFVHYIPSTYLSFNWKYVPFDYLQLILPFLHTHLPTLPHPALVTTNLIFMYEWVFFEV